jgi:transposase
MLRQLKRGTLAADLPTDRWTLRRFARVIERAFGVRYHVNSLPRLVGAGLAPDQKSAAVRRQHRVL